jgi:hypothetical protein
MNQSFQLRDLPQEIRLMTLLFLFCMLFGYGASFTVLIDQTSLTPSGIEENYNGNEDNEEADIIKFKKSKFEMLTTIHSHVFTLSLLFLTIGAMVYFTGLPTSLKYFLMLEPMVSLMVSFGSLIFMWQGHIAFKYLVYLSGGLMHTAFVVTIFLLIRELYFPKSNSAND